ncbi:MAG: hypothetical protein ACFFC7_08955 [Candidatus Hermodarchaeota archaeon]
MSITKERMEQELILILDTDYIIAGYAGNITPSCVVPAVVGIPQYSSPEIFIGEEALEFNELLNFFYPLLDSHLTELDKLEKLLSYVLLDKLKIHPFQAKNPIKCWIHSLTLRKKDELTALFTGSLGTSVPVFLSKTFLPLYSINLSSGIVIDFEEKVTIIDIISENQSKEFYEIAIGRFHVLNEINSVFESKNISLSHQDQRSFLENECYIRSDSENPQNLSTPTSFELNSGEQINIGDERFNVCEILFQSDLIEKLATSIAKEQLERREPINVLLSGVLSKQPGLRARIYQELQNLKSPSLQLDTVELIQLSSPISSAWRGANSHTLKEKNLKK